jgi:hypothetical protein
MKLMIRRLRLLEKALMVSDDDEAEDGPAAIVRARRLRRLQMEGDKYHAKGIPTVTLPSKHDAFRGDPVWTVWTSRRKTSSDMSSYRVGS